MVLSPAGQARRDALRAELTRRVAARGRRRAAALWGCALACVALATALCWMGLGGLGPLPGQPAPPQAVAPEPLVEWVRDDPSLLARWSRADAGPTRVQPVDDLELLELLRQAGRPTGLIRAGGRTWTSRDVADPLPEP